MTKARGFPKKKKAKSFLNRFREDFWQRADVRRWLLGAIFLVTMLGILLADFFPQRLELQVGQVSPRDIIAPRNVENRYQTNQMREEAAKEAVEEAAENPDNYDINPAVALEAEDKLETLFNWAAILRTGRLPTPVDEEAVEVSPGPEAAPKADADDKAAPIDLETRVRWLRTRAKEQLGLELSSTLCRRLLVTDPESFTLMTTAALESALEVLTESRIWPEELDEARAQAMAEAEKGALSREDRAVAADLAGSVVRPNLVLNPEKVEQARQAAIRGVKPEYIYRGDYIVRQGERVTEEDMQILQDLGLISKHPNYMAIFGVVLLVVILTLLLVVYIIKYTPEIVNSEGLLALLGLIIVTVTFMAKVLSLIPWEGTGYLVLVAFGCMLVTLLLDSRLAILVAVFFAVIVGMVTDGGLSYVVVALVGGITAVYSVSRVSLRSDVTRAGFVVGAAIFTTMVALGLMNQDMVALKRSYLGLFNGVVSAIFTIGFLPYLESVFGITSSLRLLELSNPNQPLLRRLLMEAPGTYHHSIIVGNLAEAAAEAVGADGLLARVGAHYHDIGKLRRPYFFVENQLSSDNPHDKISPSLSTLIITSHVKDGVELAKQYKLPNVLIDFIQQHHGTDLVKYFYRRAVESGKEDKVDEKDFRYPGPKPQNKETAIVMLADSVEAAVRSLSKATPGRIEGLVRRIIKERLGDGQLDESDLTLKDLDRVADSFTRVLSGIFHNRVEYPEKITKEEITHGKAGKATPAKGDR